MDMTNSQNSLGLGIAMAVIASFLLFALFSGSGEGDQVSAAGSRSAADGVSPSGGSQPLLDVSIARRYVKAGEVWAVVVAPGLRSRQDLITLAKAAWAQEQCAGIQIFDDENFEPYVQWTKDWPFSAVDYPAAWAKDHHVGMVNRQLTGNAPGETRVILSVYQEKFGDSALIE